MNWISIALLTAGSFALCDFFIKKSSGVFSSSVVLMIISGVAFVVSIGFVLFQKMNGSEIVFTNKAVWLPVLGGFFYGIAVALYSQMFSKGVGISVGVPFVISCTAVVGVVLGFVFLRESINFTRILGVLFVLIGVVAVSR